MAHTFHVSGRVVAEGTSLGCVLSKQGVINSEKVIGEVTVKLNKTNFT